MSRFTLDVEYDYEFDLIAICSHAKDFKLVWGLNRELGIRLARTHTDHIVGQKRGNSEHPIYRYYCESNHVTYELIKNKGQAGFVLPEQHQADYLFLVYDNDMLNVSDLISQIRDISFVSIAFRVGVEQLKNKENLITE